MLQFLLWAPYCSRVCVRVKRTWPKWFQHVSLLIFLKHIRSTVMTFQALHLTDFFLQFFALTLPIPSGEVFLLLPYVQISWLQWNISGNAMPPPLGMPQEVYVSLVDPWIGDQVSHEYKIQTVTITSDFTEACQFEATSKSQNMSKDLAATWISQESGTSNIRSQRRRLRQNLRLRVASSTG